MQHNSVKPGTGIGKLIGGAVAGAAVTLAAVGLFPRDEKPSGPAAEPDVKSVFDLDLSWRGVPYSNQTYRSEASSVSGLTLFRFEGHIRLSGTVKSGNIDFEFIFCAETGGMTREDQREFVKSMEKGGWIQSAEEGVVAFMTAVMEGDCRGSSTAIKYARDLSENGIADGRGGVSVANRFGIKYYYPHPNPDRRDDPKLPPVLIIRDPRPQ